jgi:hypothetical protein
MATGIKRPLKERRRRDKMIFVERRRGKAWMYGQMALFLVLLVCLIWLARS